MKLLTVDEIAAARRAGQEIPEQVPNAPTTAGLNVPPGCHVKLIDGKLFLMVPKPSEPKGPLVNPQKATKNAARAGAGLGSLITRSAGVLIGGAAGLVGGFAAGVYNEVAPPVKGAIEKAHAALPKGEDQEFTAVPIEQ